MARLSGSMLTVVVGFLVFATTATVQAQRPPFPGRGPQAPTEPLNATGTVRVNGVQLGVMLFLMAAGLVCGFAPKG